MQEKSLKRCQYFDYTAKSWSILTAMSEKKRESSYVKSEFFVSSQLPLWPTGACQNFLYHRSFHFFLQVRTERPVALGTSKWSCLYSSGRRECCRWTTDGEVMTEHFGQQGGWAKLEGMDYSSTGGDLLKNSSAIRPSWAAATFVWKEDVETVLKFQQIR